jgi:putative ATP-binding cassette transporter
MPPSPSAPETQAQSADVAFDQRTWQRFVGAVKAVTQSEVGGKFWLRLVALLVLMIAINGLNVVNSYVGRDFMTAIEQRSWPEFFGQALRYAGVFAALTVVAVFLRFNEERLGLLWREWLTQRLVGRYLAGAVYLRLRERGELANPDQRIADDARLFTASTLSVLLMLLNATFTILAFAGVMWTISPLLFLVAVGYAGLGSALTVVFGRPLVRLNYDQSDREASFRAELVHVRENAEGVALLGRERRLRIRLGRRLETLIGNAKRIVAVNRNLSFFTTGYNYGIQIIPLLIIGPLFMRGEVQFGVITQSAMAFSHLLGAFSLVVNQFQSLSSYAAVLARLGNLAAAVDSADVPAPYLRTCREGEERLGYENLTLRARSGDEILVDRLTVDFPSRARVLVSGAEDARFALFRATALLWNRVEGHVVRPPADRISFLPERPYLPPGTLREVIVRTGREGSVGEAEIAAVLQALGAEHVAARVGGLDAEEDWEDVLSLAEQQLLAVARVVLAAPAYVVLHHPDTTLSPEQIARVLKGLSDASIAYVALGDDCGPREAFDAVLELREGGAWSWRPESGPES